MNSQLAKSIKIISTIAMTCALGLESWNLYLHLQSKSLPPKLNSLFWLGSVALIAHGVEGLIAASKASSQDKNPLLYGIYTFFVGFVGLQELSKD
jgi:hypothetical protein